MLSLSANPVSKENARKQAEIFLQQKGILVGSEVARARGGKTTTGNQTLYVFNTIGDCGFVIVSGDDRAEPILGYTTQGSFDEETLPENFRNWLEQMSAEIETIANLPESCVMEVPQQVPGHAAINPLIITHWDQGNNDNVYNAHLPLIGGKRTITGCVAAAGAQVMYYYKWPKAPTKVVPHYEILDQYGNDASHGADTSEDLPSITFMWDKMKTKYEKDDPNTEAVNAVADLMLYCGYASQMNYGVNGSGAEASTLAFGMGQFFDYDPSSWRDVNRSSYSIAEWDALIYNELALGHPVIYSGSFTDGHSFICDGYDGAGLYHFNWGWGGSNDGYFKLQATNPYGYSEFWRMGYIDCQHAIIGLHPNNTQWASGSSDENIAVVSNVEVNNTNVFMNFSNKDNETKGFGLGIGELMGDGSVVPVDKKYEHYISSQLPTGYYWSNTFDFSGYDLSEGIHQLVPISLLNGKTEWERCRPFDVYFEVKVSSGKKTVTAHPTVSLKVSEFILPEGAKLTGQIIKVDVKVKNLADEYKQPLYLFASQTESKVYKYAAGSAIEQGGSETVTFYFQPDAVGSWNLWVATDYYATNIIGQTKVSVEDPPTGVVELKSVVQNAVFGKDDVTYSFTAKNVGSTANYRDLETWLFVYDEHGYGTGSSSNRKLTSLTLQPGEEKTVTVHYEGLEDGTTYGIITYYRPSYYSSSMTAFDNYYFTFEKPSNDVIQGDASGDGELDSNDVKALIDYMIGSGTINMEAADLDGDNMITIADIIKLVNLILSK